MAPAMSCRNPKCEGKNPIKSGWCTATKCKTMRKLVRAAEAAAQQQEAAALAGAAPLAPAQCVDDGLQCWQVVSVHGQMECGLDKLGKAEAPVSDDEQIHFLVFGSFAANEDDHEHGRGKQQLRWVKFKELLKNCEAEDAKKLSAFEKDRVEPHRAARKRLLDAIEAEEAAEEEVEELD